MNRFTRILALPLLSAGIIGAALGLASTASAGMTVNDDGSMIATPDTFAHPQMIYPHRGVYYWPGQAFGPNTDTSVYQSR